MAILQGVRKYPLGTQNRSRKATRQRVPKMIEMRWLVYKEEETLVPPVHSIQYGKPFEKVMSAKRKLQYRQQYNATVYAGMPGQDFINQTAKTVWSDWKDVPEVTNE